MKLKYILPVGTIASVAAVVAPLATSCTKNNEDEAIKMATKDRIDDEECIRTDLIQFNSTDSFKVTFNWKDFKDLENVENKANGWCIECIDENREENIGFERDSFETKFWLDGKQLVINQDFEHESDYAIYPKKELDIKDNSVFIIEFKLLESDAKPGYLFVHGNK